MTIICNRLFLTHENARHRQCETLLPADERAATRRCHQWMRVRPRARKLKFDLTFDKLIKLSSQKI